MHKTIIRVSFLDHQMKVLQNKILSWYSIHKRDLPWRKTTNPYYILLSEIMLQQTQVDRVIEKYNLFTNKYPNIQDLANANTAQLIKDWSGLGYNRRVIFLQKCAQAVLKEYQGKMPTTCEELLGLPGIGPYTAAAICSFAYNHEVPCIDTNIRRVLIHELKLKETIDQKELREIAKNAIPKNKSREWHNALMDYGSSVLTVKKTGIKPIGKQPKFKDSRRYYRGQVLKMLKENKSVTIPLLKKVFAKIENEIKDILKDLQRDGLIIVEKERIKLP